MRNRCRAAAEHRGKGTDISYISTEAENSFPVLFVAFLLGPYKFRV